MTPKRITPLKLTLILGLAALTATAILPHAAHAASITSDGPRAAQTTVPTLDTHSLGLFRVSIDKMLVSLTPHERDELHAALRRLADEALFNGEAPGGEPLSFKTPTVEVLYDSMPDKLNGLTFGEILRLKN